MCDIRNRVNNQTKEMIELHRALFKHVQEKDCFTVNFKLEMKCLLQVDD